MWFQGVLGRRILQTIAILPLILSGCGSQTGVENPEPREMSFLTRDGVRLVGSLYVPEQAGSSGLILVHDDGGDRSDFEPFARQAHRDGYFILAFDRRGHGDSTLPNSTQSGTASLSETMNDIDAARQTLTSAGADPENLAIVGAGSGANLALAYAAANADIQATVLLSPARKVKDTPADETLRAYGLRPVLLMVSSGDTHALASAESLRAIASGHCEIHEYDGMANGTAIFDAIATSSGQTLLWLNDIIGPQAVNKNRELDAEMPTKPS